MVVAFGTSERAAQPHGAQRAHAVGAVLREVFLILNASLLRGAQNPVVGRGDFLFDTCVRQEVTG